MELNPDKKLGETEKKSIISSQEKLEGTKIKQREKDDPSLVRTNVIKGPLVVMFGPSHVGKTVTLLRLTQYLESRVGGLVKPVANFRNDNSYLETIERFNEIKEDSYLAPESTGEMDFLLLDVSWDGRPKFQILEAPGEHFFDPKDTTKPYHSYFETILNSEYKKLFIFFFEVDMFESNTQREEYGKRISKLLSQNTKPGRDRAIVLCNKVDSTEYFQGGLPVYSEIKRVIYEDPNYQSLKKSLSKSRLGRIYFVPFSAGSFKSYDDDRGVVFTMSKEHYAKELFRSIEKCLFPSWWDNFFGGQ